MSAPVETKVTAGTASAAVAGVVLWVLTTYVFKSGMPQGLESLVYLAVPAVLAGAAGYLAPHTHRPDLGGLINVPLPPVPPPAPVITMPSPPPGSP